MRTDLRIARTGEASLEFTGEAVRAILAGRKTQTRRVGRDLRSLDPVLSGFVHRMERSCDGKNWLLYKNGEAKPAGFVREPYPVWTKLWVRERWTWVSHDKQMVRYEADDSIYKLGEDGLEAVQDDSWRLCADPTRWYPMHTAPWGGLCRLQLEVAGIRLERLQSISEEDAQAEGAGMLVAGWLRHPVVPHKRGHFPGNQIPPEMYSDMSSVGLYALWWDRISNQRERWADNPLVWVITFRRIQ